MCGMITFEGLMLDLGAGGWYGNFMISYIKQKRAIDKPIKADPARSEILAFVIHSKMIVLFYVLPIIILLECFF